MSQITKMFIVVLAMTLTSAFSDNQCDKCNIEKIKIVNEHIDSLTFKIVYDFLCTFDSICNANAEYSEWSNETLFKVLQKAPAIFFQALAKVPVDNKLLLKEINNPIREFDLQKIYDKVKNAAAPKDIKSKYLDTLLSLAEKNGEKINK